MKAYRYNKFSFEYEGEIDCQLDVLASAAEGKEVYLLPAYSTFIEPLPEKESAQVVFDGEKWIYVYPPEPTPEEIKQQEIARLKEELAATDYKIIKCSEYSLAGQDLPYDIAELHANRQALRDRINELEGE